MGNLFKGGAMRQSIILIIFIVSLSWSYYGNDDLNFYRPTRDFGDRASLYKSKLVYSKSEIHVTETFLEIEEEITLEALRSGPVMGDTNSLEFIGTFCLPDEGMIRSSLLWFGDEILKGKLLDAHTARSLYENVVDRDTEILYPMDPSLIEKGEGRGACLYNHTEYTYSIYPVKLGESRTMRVRYDIPWDLSDSTMYAELAFIGDSYLGYTYLETKGEQTMVFTNELDSPIKLEYRGVKFEVVPGYSYDNRDARAHVVFDGLLSTVTLDLANRQGIKETHIATGPLEGFYQDVLLAIPQELRELDQDSIVTSQLKISNMGVNRIVNVPKSYLKENHYLRLFYKSDSTWVGDFEWLFYDVEGDLIQSNVVTIDSIESGDSSLVYQWAYSQDIELGHYLGYVDSKMSLLALEQDTLPEFLKNLYWDQGVPLLTSDEIFTEFDDLVDLDLTRDVIPVNNNTLGILDSEIQEIIHWTLQGNTLVVNLITKDLAGAQVKFVNLQGQVLKYHILRSGNNVIQLPNFNRSEYIVMLEYSNKRLPIEL